MLTCIDSWRLWFSAYNHIFVGGILNRKVLGIFLHKNWGQRVPLLSEPPDCDQNVNNANWIPTRMKRHSLPLVTVCIKAYWILVQPVVIGGEEYGSKFSRWGINWFDPCADFNYQLKNIDKYIYITKILSYINKNININRYYQYSVIYQQLLSSNKIRNINKWSKILLIYGTMRIAVVDKWNNLPIFSRSRMLFKKP